MQRQGFVGDQLVHQGQSVIRSRASRSSPTRVRPLQPPHQVTDPQGGELTSRSSSPARPVSVSSRSTSATHRARASPRPTATPAPASPPHVPVAPSTSPPTGSHAPVGRPGPRRAAELDRRHRQRRPGPPRSAGRRPAAGHQSPRGGRPVQQQPATSQRGQPGADHLAVQGMREPPGCRRPSSPTSSRPARSNSSTAPAPTTDPAPRHRAVPTPPPTPERAGGVRNGPHPIIDHLGQLRRARQPSGQPPTPRRSTSTPAAWAPSTSSRTKSEFPELADQIAATAAECTGRPTPGGATCRHPPEVGRQDRCARLRPDAITKTRQGWPKIAAHGPHQRHMAAIDELGQHPSRGTVKPLQVLNDDHDRSRR